MKCVRLISHLYEYMLLLSDEKQGLNQDHRGVSAVRGYAGRAETHPGQAYRQPTDSLMCMFLPREKVINAIFLLRHTQYFIFSQKIKGFRMRISDNLTLLFHFECKYISQHSAKTNNGKH